MGKSVIRMDREAPDCAGHSRDPCSHFTSTVVRVGRPLSSTIPDLIAHREVGIIALRKLTSELEANHAADGLAIKVLTLRIESDSPGTRSLDAYRTEAVKERIHPAEVS